MQIKIHKYEIIDGDTVIELPAASTFLSFGFQNGRPYIWVQLNNIHLKEARRFVILATGENQVGPGHYKRLQTVHVESLVFHLFEVIK